MAEYINRDYVATVGPPEYTLRTKQVRYGDQSPNSREFSLLKNGQPILDSNEHPVKGLMGEGSKVGKNLMGLSQEEFQGAIDIFTKKGGPALQAILQDPENGSYAAKNDVLNKLDKEIEALRTEERNTPTIAAKPPYSKIPPPNVGQAPPKITPQFIAPH